MDLPVWIACWPVAIVATMQPSWLANGQCTRPIANAARPAGELMLAWDWTAVQRYGQGET